MNGAAESDPITIQSIDEETGYVKTKVAHELRLREQKKPKTLTEMMDKICGGPLDRRSWLEKPVRIVRK